MGLITRAAPAAAAGAFSRATSRLLREISELTSSGIGIEGVRRILQLENRVAALAARNEARRRAGGDPGGPAPGDGARRTPGPGNKLPVLRQPGQPVRRRLAPRLLRRSGRPGWDDEVEVGRQTFVVPPRRSSAGRQTRRS